MEHEEMNKNITYGIILWGGTWSGWPNIVMYTAFSIGTRYMYLDLAWPKQIH